MKLITFGCSWTKGIGIPYEKGMSKKEYLEVRRTQEDVMDKHSFRGILSERLGFENINFATGGSSNQRQERFATEYFNTHSPEDTVVLWGITSIGRNEVMIDGERYNIKGGSNQFHEWRKPKLRSHVRYYYEHFYDEKNEIERLGNAMIHWNKFFEAYHIPNLWFQTFNTYEFPQKIDRLLPIDLLTHITHYYDIEDIHESSWRIDSKRIERAEYKGLVNPYSLHPTKETHIKLADILEKPLRKIL